MKVGIDGLEIGSTWITRLGKEVLADEVFLAWGSADLPRMVAALGLDTNPIDRHFLLMNIVQVAYKTREDPAMADLCIKVGMIHVAEFARLAPPLRKQCGGFMPSVPTFGKVVRLLVKRGEFDAAKGILRRVSRFWPDADYDGDVAKIEKARAKASRD